MDKPTEATAQPDNAPQSPQSKRKGFPSLLDMLLLLLLFVVSAGVGGMAAGLLNWEMPYVDAGEPIRPENEGLILFVSYLVQMCTMLLLTLLYRKLRGGRGRIARFSLRGLAPYRVLQGVVTLLAISVVVEPLLTLLPEELFPMPEMARSGWALASVVLLAPLFEELLCRGVVLESLRSRYGVMTAWIGSSLFFAIIHLHPTMVVNAFIIGLLFGFLALHTRSLWAPIVLHAFNNGMALMMMWTHLPGGEGRALSDYSLREVVGSQELYLLLYAVALGIVLWSGGKMLRRLNTLRRNEGKNRPINEIISPENPLDSGKKA